MKVLLSVKPRFSELIFAGVKRFEFRRCIFKRMVSEVVVYASAPSQKIIGEFSIKRIITASPKELWHKCHDGAGISRAYFFSYFRGKRIAHAIEIENPIKYREPLDIKEQYGCRPPQSFLYI